MSPQSSEIEKLKAEIKNLRAEINSLHEDAAFKPIFDQAPLGIFRTSIDGKFLKVNQTLCELLDYADRNELFENVHNLATDVYIDPSEREKTIKELLEAKSYAKFEMDFKRKTGEIITCNISAKLIRDDEGKIKYIEGIAEDITDIKRAEAEKKRSENLYRTLVNTISDTIVISDLSGKIEFVSPSIKNISETLSEKDIVGTNILDWIDKNHHYKAKENIHKILNNLPYNFEEYNMVRQGGEEYYAEIRTSVLRGEDNKPQKLISLIQDITNRKKTDEILRETQDLYRTIIELSPAGIMITYKDEILFLNSSMAKILDTEDLWEAIGSNFQSIIHESGRAEVLSLIESAEKNRKHGEISEVDIISLSGKQKTVDLVVSPIFYDGKKCSFLYINDISKRVNAEKALKIDKQLMDAFWDTLPDSITFKNLKGEYFKVNSQFVKWSKMKTKESVLGKTDLDIFGEKHFKYSRQEENKVAQKREVVINELRKESWPGNQEKWVMLTKMPLYDINQNVVGIFSFTRDITQQKNAELEIRNREYWFRYIFDQSPIAKVITDKKFRIRRINNSLKGLLGLPEEEILGQTAFNFFDKQVRSEVKEWLKIIKDEKNRTIQRESVIITKKTDSRVVLLQAVHLQDLTNEHGDYLIHFVDIHDRKITEEELRVRNTELNNFVYKVSHDLRAPLTSIKGLINLVYLENDPAVYNQYIQMINGRVERLDDFIRDVLSHSKNLNVEIKISEIDLAKLINECISQMAYHPNFGKVKLDIDIKGKTLYSDYQRLHEILRNLISNAYQYSRKNVESFLKIESKISKKQCKIVIEDNGLGIKKKFQPHIFEMFYRANENVEGSGLGLYIVKLSLENLKGKIEFDSKVNKGTRFEITIPNRVK